MPKVYNRSQRHIRIPPNAVYCGRGSPYGNEELAPTREERIAKFEAKVEADPARKAKIKEDLRGKDLICWCKPLPCHCDYLLRIANED